MWGLILLLISPFVIANKELTDNFKEDSTYFNDKEVTINCGDVITANTILTSDLNCEGNGLIINNSNVNLYCDGHSITYGNSGKNNVYGIYLIGIPSISGHDNVTIKNCEIIEGNELGNGKHGIYLEGEPTNPFPGLYSENIIVKNNQVKIMSKRSHALRTWGIGPESIIQDNYLESLGDEGKGLSMMCTMQTIFLKNTIKTSLIDGIGIYVGDWGNNQNEIKENVITESDIGIRIFLEEYIPTYQFWNDEILYENNQIIKSNIGMFFSEDGHPLGPNSIITNNMLVDITDQEILMKKNVDNQIFENQSFKSYKIVNSTLMVKNDVGAVWFNERLTLSGNNLSEDIKIENNNISIDIVSKPGLNVSGKIYFYGPQTFAFGPQYIPLKDGIKCNNPFHLNICTDFKYEETANTFSFDVSEMAESFRVDGTYLPLPQITANPDFGPVGSNIDINVSWFFADVGNEFIIMFDDYEVGSFIYPEINYPLENSFIINIIVPSMPTGEYDVNLKEDSIGKDIFTVTSSSCKKEFVEEVESIKDIVVEKQEVRKIIEKNQNIIRKPKIVEMNNDKYINEKTTTNLDKKLFYSFYI